jgi:hypothetical protein
VGLLRGLAVAVVQRCGETTAEQGLYTAEQGGDGAKVWGVGHGIGDKGAGPICWAVGHPRCAGPAPRLAGDLGWPLRVGEEGEEGERELTSGAKWSEGERERARVLRWRVRRGALTGGPHALGRGRSCGAARPGQAGPGKERGPAGKKRSGGPREGDRAAGLACFPISFPFLFQTNSNLFEFKSNLNSTPMHSTK